MSRGLGRWQRLLLHELYHNPKPPSRFNNRPWISVRGFTTTDSEYSAARRAARSLVAAGLAIPYFQWTHTLYQVDPAPGVTCPQCGVKCSELWRNNTPRNTYKAADKCSEKEDSGQFGTLTPVGQAVSP